MKTNTKRVINILLTLAMMISLITAFGGAALAAPVLSGASASLAGDDVTLNVSAAGAAGAFASLRVVLKEDVTTFVHVDQFILADGDNEIVFPIEAADYKGLVLRITLAAAAADGTIVTYLAVNVDKDILNALIDGAPDEDLYEHTTWAVYADALAKAIVVRDEPFASQIEVDAAVAELEAGLDQLLFKMTSIVINAPAATTVMRNQSYTFTFTGAPAPVYDAEVVWSVSNITYATVDPLTGVVKVLNKTGTVILTATDPYTGTYTSIVLRIV